MTPALGGCPRITTLRGSDILSQICFPIEGNSCSIGRHFGRTWGANLAKIVLFAVGQLILGQPPSVFGFKKWANSGARNLCWSIIIKYRGWGCYYCSLPGKTWAHCSCVCKFTFRTFCNNGNRIIKWKRQFTILLSAKKFFSYPYKQVVTMPQSVAVASISIIRPGMASRVIPSRLIGGDAPADPSFAPSTSKLFIVSSTSVV